MVVEVDRNKLLYLQEILNKEFNVSYKKGTFSKEYVYLLENEIIGLLVYSLIYDRMELEYIYVDKEKRNIGIASKLMNYMIEEAIINNIKNITLEVNVNNQAAICLYKKFGFTICATRENYYNGQDGYLMIRE